MRCRHSLALGTCSRGDVRFWQFAAAAYLSGVVAVASLIDWRLGVVFYLLIGFLLWLAVRDVAVLWRMCLAWAPAILWDKARDFTCSKKQGGL